MSVGQVIYSPERTPPAWAGDGLNNKTILPGGVKLDASQFTSAELTVNAIAAVDATSVVLSSGLTREINVGQVIDFGAKKFARLTVAAPVGATTLTVSPLVTALAVGDVGNFSGLKFIPSGTLIGRTLAERDAGTAFGPGATTDDELFLLAYDVPDAIQNPFGAAYRQTCLVFENYLPGWSSLSAGLKTAIRSRYQCMLGV